MSTINTNGINPSEWDGSQNNGNLSTDNFRDNIQAIKDALDEIPPETGNLTDAEVQQLQNINAVTISNTQWGYLGGQDQAVATTDAVTFSTVDTGQGANELYAMDQAVQTTDAVTFATVNTGQGANELYPMDQGVRTSDSVEFGSIAYDNATSGLAATDVQAAIDEQVSRTGNAGSISGFRNVLINGDFRINQRGFGGDWSTLTNGDYGYDRWARKDASTISQVVEAGNFKPSTTYTLSGVNVTTQQLTSPASGDWQIDLPNTADEVQLEEGSVATPFERRPIGTELALCQRYYRSSVSVSLRVDVTSGAVYATEVSVAPEMRAQPAGTVVSTGHSGGAFSGNPDSLFTDKGRVFVAYTSSATTTGARFLVQVELDAEFAIAL